MPAAKSKAATAAQVHAVLGSDDAEVKRAAILALTEWPDGAPIPDLINTARTASTPAHQVLMHVAFGEQPAVPREHSSSSKHVMPSPE